MKRAFLLVLSLCMLLTSCAVPVKPLKLDTLPEPMNVELELTDTAISTLLAGGSDAAEPLLAEMAYTHSASLSTQETVAAYIEQMYLSYSRMSYIDFTSLLDTSTHYNKNAQAYLKLLLQRRRLISDNNLCYVETGKYPYTIQFLEQEQLEDNRISYWKSYGLGDGGEKYVHFRIKGQAGKTYPPMMAINTQQTIRLRKVNGMWKITYHYYPGCVNIYRQSASSSLQPVSDSAALSLLKEEFAQKSAVSVPEVPAGARKYSGKNAAEYAMKYTESRNGNFYSNVDWIGNCANFTSQSMWYGFNDGTAAKMTSKWFGGHGGGSPAWENVQQNWNYITGNNEMGGVVLNGVSNVKAGDLVQTRFKRTGADGYNHTLMVVDSDKLLLAQNTPDTFIYYSDLTNVDVRFYRPVYLEQ